MVISQTIELFHALNSKNYRGGMRKASRRETQLKSLSKFSWEKKKRLRVAKAKQSKELEEKVYYEEKLERKTLKDAEAAKIYFSSSSNF